MLKDECLQLLTIEGPDDDLARCIADAGVPTTGEGAYDVIDFERITPMPRGFEVFDFTFDVTVELTSDQRVRFNRKAVEGSLPEWYVWRMRQWGTEGQPISSWLERRKAGFVQTRLVT